MCVKWLRTALLNLENEAEYISHDSLSAAIATVGKILNSVEQLKTFPSLGRAGRVPGTRELVVPDTPYIIPYRVKQGVVEILRLFHSARKWPSTF